MKKYLITYTGNSKRFNSFEAVTNAPSELEAIKMVYTDIKNVGAFLDGDAVIDEKAATIEYDGGFFYAELIEG
jgi:hypothetical protein